MEYKLVNSGFGYVIRLDKGERLIRSLMKFADDENISGAFFYGIGAVKNATIGYRDESKEKKEYIVKEFLDCMELVSLNGNITLLDGQPYLHAHAVLGDDKMNAFGGHLQEAEIALTCEIFVHLQHDVQLVRKHDKETELNLLHFE